jgi:murein DD-endopeptidase MepM/ murein hydrolase activator NlpD
MRKPLPVVAFLLLAGGQAEALDLEIPLACTLGTDCWVQQYPDHDKGPGAADFTCGTATYDGHDGTDFRVRDTLSEVKVIAAADGAVKAIRNTMEDKLISDASDLKSVSNIECGNGVVLTHPGGFETQYCHMRKGSITVRAGQKVKAGDALGLVGYSGAAQFPHLHLSLRRAGKKLDPFSGELGQDCAADDTSMWSKKAQASLTYQPAAVLDFGWHSGKVETAMLEKGELTREAPRSDWPALVAYAWLINLQKDDEITLTMQAGTTTPTTNKVKLDRNKAQYVLFAGKKRGDAWKGPHQAELVVTANGKEKLRRKIDLTIE